MSSNRFLIGSFLICVDYLWERVWQLSDNSQSPRPNSIQNYFPTFGSSNQLSSWWSRVVPIFFPSPENEPYLCKHRGLKSVNNVEFIDKILFASRTRINVYLTVGFKVVCYKVEKWISNNISTYYLSDFEINYQIL